MTELILDYAEESFIAGNIGEAYYLAYTARELDPFFGSVDKYVAAYGVHEAMQKKTPTGEINYYAVLGVLDISANVADIKQRFCSIAPLVNPDENCSAAAKEAHRQVRIAWHTLSRPSSRREYDIRAGFRVGEEKLRMMEHGLLSPERAKKAYEKKQRKQKQIRMGTPIKSSKPPSKPQSSQKQQQASKNGDVKAKKRIKNDSDDDDYIILSPKRRKG